MGWGGGILSKYVYVVVFLYANVLELHKYRSMQEARVLRNYVILSTLKTNV